MDWSPQSSKRIQDISGWGRHFPNQNLTVYAGAGWLFHNQQLLCPVIYARALFRYVAHADFDLYKNKLVLYGDVESVSRTEMPATKPHRRNWIGSSRLRRAVEEIWNSRSITEQDQPLDRAGLIQKYLAVQLRVSFDISKAGSWHRSGQTDSQPCQ